MLKSKGLVVHCYLLLVASCIILHAEAESVVKEEERWPVVSTEYGDISAVRISDGINASYLLHLFTLSPNSLLLPLVLNSDMLFYVRAGNGRLSWTEDNGLKYVDLRRGDVHSLQKGTVFYMWAQTQPERLMVDAFFANFNQDMREPATEPYSSIQDMVLGFDPRILQATFKVSEDVIEELMGGAKPQLITRVYDFIRDDIPVEMKKKKSIIQCFRS